MIIIDNKFVRQFDGLGAEVFSPEDYILYRDDHPSANIYNLTSSLSYQGVGYYVSLLAMARMHRVFPEPMLIQDLKDKNMQRIYSAELDELIQRKLSTITSETFELSVYFGANMAEKYMSLAKELHRLIKAPMFRVYFKFNGRWIIQKIKITAIDDLVESHREFLKVAIKDYFSKKHHFRDTKKSTIYDMAILVDPEESSPPSDKKALEKFAIAGRKLGFRVDFITKKDLPFILEYDAFFIRETTYVTHHTYRAARRAQADGLVVIDDPQSIIKCTNKVFLEELLDRLDLDRPRTIILGKSNYKEKLSKVSYPCVIKKPDSAFSQGVHKAASEAEFLDISNKLFKHSELIVVQDFLPTDYDWRVGILNGEILYICKYYMAENHWQIINNTESGKDYGNFECLDPKLVDPKVIQTALKVSNSIGNGLYGVDLKQSGNKVYVIEVNDNPSIDAGVEDEFLGDELYLKIMKYFLNECNRKRFNNGR